MGKTWIERRASETTGKRRLYVIIEQQGQQWHDAAFEERDIEDACKHAEGLAETYGMECTKQIVNR